MVIRSASACNGWWSSVSALTTGIVAWCASSSTSACAKVRITIASHMRETTFAVSAIGSPRPSCNSSPRVKIGWPPRRTTAVSIEMRVRVEAFVKCSSTVRPASAP